MAASAEGVVERLACPCCGWRAFDAYGSFDICDVCLWQDDEVQLSEPEYEGGANRPSLMTAQRNFLDYGAKEQRSANRVRGPKATDVKDPLWRPYDPSVDGDDAVRPFPYWLKS